MENYEIIEKVCNDYLSELNSLREIYPIVIENAQKDYDNYKKEFDNIKQKLEEQTDTKRSKKHPMPLEKRQDYIQKEELYEIKKYALKDMPTAFILSMVALYDYFLKTLIKTIYTLQPDLLNSIQRVITYSDLSSLVEKKEETINAFFVEKEADMVLRENYLEQLSWFDKKIGLTLMDIFKENKSLVFFTELMERRNLYAHNGGYVSGYYLNQTKDWLQIKRENYTINQYLEADIDYLNNAYEILYEIGVEISHLTWRKLLKSNLRESDRHLHNMTYKLLLLGKYRIANRLLKFACSLGKYHSDQVRRIHKINLAQSYKWLGKEDKCQEILLQEDWTACDSSFQLAEKVLLDKFDECEELMTIAAQSGDIEKTSFIEWPLFRKFRDTAIYKEIFNKCFSS